MRPLLLQRGVLRGQATGQGVRTGSIYLALALGISGVLTYVFQGASARFLGLEEYGALATLWSATFLFAQVLWIGTTQTLGRYIAEREAQGESPEPVIQSSRRVEMYLLGGFLTVALLLSPVLTHRFFGGRVLLTAAFIAATSFYALAYFKRGLLSGHRQFTRLSGMFVIESFSRALLAGVLLIAGAGVVGPAMAIALAPVLSVLLIRVARVPEPAKLGSPFSVGGAFRFAMPVLVCMACAQLLANGGPILISGLGGREAHEQAGLLLAALTLTRAPQYVLSPVISNLLPHLSRIAALEDLSRYNRFVGKAVAFVLFVGVGLIGGTWLLGELAMRALYGREFVMSRGVLTVLATLAASYLLCELLNQVLFARGLARRAATCWLVGIVITVIAIAVLDMDILSRASYALAIGTTSTAIAQTIAYVTAPHRPVTPTQPVMADS